MKPKTTRTLSGCIVWIIVFGALSACFLPVIGLVIAALLTLAPAAPAGMLIARLFKPGQQVNQTTIESI